MLSNEAIEEYRKLYKQEYGKEISYSEASEQGNRILNFFEILMQIDQRIKNTTDIKKSTSPR